MQRKPAATAEARRTSPDPRPEDVSSELRRRYDELTHSQKRIAETIVEDPAFVAFATVEKLAGRLRVSPSTIVRFAYRMGFSGYPELQDRVRQQLLTRLEGPKVERELPDSALDEVTAASLGRDIENLERTIRVLPGEQVATAIETLAHARSVYIVGAATGESVALYATIVLSRVRERVVLVGSAQRAATVLLDVGSDDAVLAFTFPPYATSTLNAVVTAQEQGATVVTVTDSPISPVGQRADIVLPAAVGGIGAQNSLVAAISVANVLFNGVSAILPTAVTRYARAAALGGRWSLYLLGDGAGG